MKKIVFLGLALVLSFFLFRNFQSHRKVLGDEATQTSEKPRSTNRISLGYNNRAIDVYWAEADPWAVSLNQNFEQKIAASELFTSNDCNLLINGGFYSKDNKPIGLFISERETLSGFQENQLFNGIFSINEFGIPKINSVPEPDVLTALQAGPLLKENNQYLAVSLVRDEPARRSVAAVTGDNKLIFMIFLDNESAFLGPWLSDLPDVLGDFESKTGISIADAVNLDGGSASAFYTEDVGISEISPVGSFFCVR